MYWHVKFNWLVSAFTFLSSCDECQPLLNYWFLSKRRAACHQDWKFDLIRRVNKKEQLWNIIIYIFVLRINAQTNSCFIEFVKSSYFYIINQPNLCLRLWSSNYTWNFLGWFVLKNNIEQSGLWTLYLELWANLLGLGQGRDLRT